MCGEQVEGGVCSEQVEEGVCGEQVEGGVCGEQVEGKVFGELDAERREDSSFDISGSVISKVKFVQCLFINCRVCAMLNCLCTACS